MASVSKLFILFPGSLVGSLAGLLLLAGAAQATLLTNGGFESSSSNFSTPPGWVNIGHTDGVLIYSQIPSQPVSEGLNFYSIGGAGSNGLASVGEGIAQTFTTVVGASYRATYAYSAENGTGWATETLRVAAASSFVDHVLVPTGTNFFTRPWSAGVLDFVASGTSTTLSFTLQAITGGGAHNNDPLLDGVSVVLTAVPEPQVWGLWAAGLLVLGARARLALRANPA